MFVMILISFSFVYAAGTTECKTTKTTTLKVSPEAKLQAQQNYVLKIAKEVDYRVSEAKTAKEKAEELSAAAKIKAAEKEIGRASEEDVKEAQKLAARAKEEAELKTNQVETAKQYLKEQQAEAERLKTEALKLKLSTRLGSLSEYNKVYNELSWANYWIDKWGWMGNWKSGVDRTFTDLYLGIEPITSHLCDLWTVGTDSTSNMAFGEDGSASAHVEGVVVETREDNPSPGKEPIVVMKYRITFFVSNSVLMIPENAATIQVNLYSGNTKAKELGSYKLGEGVPQIGAQGEDTLIQTGGVYDLVCLRFLETWRYKGDFRTFLRKCPDKEIGGDCLCNRFGAAGNALPGFSKGTTEAWAHKLGGD